MRLRPKVALPLAILGAGVVLALVIATTGPSVEPQPRDTPAPVVRVVEAQPEQLQLAVHTHGTVAPRTESELVPEVSGPVVWISPSLVSGGFFQAGEPLLRIDPRDYEVALERASASLARAESELDRARKDLARRRGLADRGAASPAQLDDAISAERVAASVAREARAALAQAERDLGRTEIVAPYDGRVRDERVDVGQFVNRGATIATLYAVDTAEIRLPVPDEELAFLDLPLLHRGAARNGSQPEVILRARFAGGEHVWRGRVVRTEGEIDPKSRMVTVVAQVEDPYAAGSGRPPLAVGLFVEAEIRGRIADGVVVLPRSALRPGGRVLVVDGEGRLRFRDVEVLRVARDRALIRSGLEAGERVCVSALEIAIEGMRVRVAGSAS